MQVRLKPFLQNVSRQRLTVSVNGVDFGFFLFNADDTKADQPRWCEMSISIAGSSALASRPLRISFALPDLPSAESLGLTAHAPILGMGFLSARITGGERVR